MNNTLRGATAFCSSAARANNVPKNVSARQNDRVLPPALKAARAVQKAITPSATVASAISVAPLSTDSVVQPGAAAPNGSSLVADVIVSRRGDSISTSDAGSG